MVIRRMAYSRREAAMALGLSLPMIDGLVKSGKLRVIRVPGRDGGESERARILVPKIELERYIRQECGWPLPEARQRQEDAVFETELNRA